MEAVYTFETLRSAHILYLFHLRPYVLPVLIFIYPTRTVKVNRITYAFLMVNTI